MKREFYYDYKDRKYYPTTLTLCYHTKNPVVYNAGTEWERQNSDFLLYMLSCEVGKEDTMVEYVKRINENHETQFENLPIEWEKYDIDYLYVSQQEPFED